MKAQAFGRVGGKSLLGVSSPASRLAVAVELKPEELQRWRSQQHSS